VTAAVNLNSVESVSVGVLVDSLGRLADARMRAICSTLEIAVDCSGVTRGARANAR